MTKKNLLNLSYLSLFVAIGILLLLVFADNLQASSLLQDRVFYLSLILMGVFSAIALFGFLKSTATVKGDIGGIAIDVAGPAALAVIVVIGGFYLIPRYEFFDVTIRAVDSTGTPVYSDRKATVKITLPTGVREADFTRNGEATIKGLPYSLFKSKQKILVEVYYYDQMSPDVEYTLNLDVIEVELKENPNGTPEGILNRKKAHLEVLKLLAPYKLILGENGNLEIDIYQYFEENSLNILKAADIKSPIEISSEQKYDFFDVLYENTPEYLNFNGKTYADLIHESAINFRRNVSVMSQIDSEGMDPEILRELIKISRAHFVVMAAGERPGSEGANYLSDSFWGSLAYETKRIHDDNVLNFFTEFSDF